MFKKWLYRILIGWWVILLVILIGPLMVLSISVIDGVSYKEEFIYYYCEFVPDMWG